MEVQPLARLNRGAALATPASNSASMPGLTSICAISRTMWFPFRELPSGGIKAVHGRARRAAHKRRHSGAGRNPESSSAPQLDSGFGAELVIGPATGRTRWHRPGMTALNRLRLRFAGAEGAGEV